MKRAPFIVVEGLDRSGKSTQTALLQARIADMGLPVRLVKFPGDLRIPRLCRSLTLTP